MDNVIYRKILVKATDSPDGETPTEVIVTHEVNGYALFKLSFDSGTELLKFNPYSSYPLIEEAVKFQP